MARPRKQVYTLDMYLKKVRERDVCNDGDVQRDYAWTNEQANELIVTVLTDDYIPPLILGEEDNSQLHIVDGGCRTAALNEFRHGRKITSSVEHPIIYYKQKIVDENGDVSWEDAAFNIKSKTYDMLPEELKKKFDEYQIETVIHEHCTKRMISEYIKRYNRHTPMNQNQKAFTYIDNFAGYIRNILACRFFLNDFSDFKETEKKKGVLERVVVETVMCMNHIDEWKKQAKSACDYLNQNGTEEEFSHLEDNLHRLESIVTDEVKDIFNSKDSFIFLTLFDRFTNLGVEDINFCEFLKEFKKVRKLKKNDAGLLFDEIDKEKSTKDKTVIIAKLDMLEEMMLEFLHINKMDIEEVTDEESFISEVVEIGKEEVHQDIECYKETLVDLKDSTIKDGSKLLDKRNEPSLLAMVAYSYKEDVDLDKWLSEYASRNNTYYADQKKNFYKMRDDLIKYSQRMEVVS